METTLKKAPLVGLNLDSKAQKSTKLLLAVFSFALTLMLVYLGFELFAAGSDADTGLSDQFDPFYSSLKGIATGAPGKSLMLMMVVMIILFSTLKPNFIGFAGCVLGILVLSNAPAIIDAGVTANIADYSTALITDPLNGLIDK